MFKKILNFIINWLLFTEKEITIQELYENQNKFPKQISEFENGSLKFIGENIPTNRMWVKTHDGWNLILSALKTVKYKKFTITLMNGLKLSGADSHLVITDTGECVHISQLLPKDKIYTKSGISEVKSIVESCDFEHMYDLQLSPVSDHSYFTNDILSHNTTSSAAFILYFALFNKSKDIAILANKQSTTKEILDRIKNMYRYLPMWLKPGVKEWNKHSIEFENGCRIIAASTSSSSISGKTISVLYIDEFALIPKNIVEEFIDSTFPVVSASVTSRILISSTPKGKNHFYRFFKDAQNRKVTKSPFVAKDIPWDAHPDRDEAWRKAKILELGSLEKFNQEFAGDFLDTSDMLISGATLEYIERNQVMQPLVAQLSLNGSDIKGLKIFEKPIKKNSAIKESKNNIYVLIVDVGEGKEMDYSTCVVIDVSSHPFKQVATFKSNTIDIITFPYIIYQLGSYYNDAYVVVENNFNGSSIVKDLWFELEYPNLVNLNFLSESKMRVGNYIDLGVKTTKKSKKQGSLFMKHLLENGHLLILDTDIIDELFHYVKHPLKGTFCAEEGFHDDLAMCLVIFSYMAKTQMYFKNILDSINNKSEKTDEEKSVDLNPFVINTYKNEILDKEKEKLDKNSNFYHSLNRDGGKTNKDKEIENINKDISWIF